MDWGRVLVDSVRASIGPEAALFALAAVGLNVHFGFTGLLNFGQVGFMLVGAYGVAIVVSTLGASLWLGIVVSVVMAVALALLLGVPTLRLRADYLAITTLAAAETLRLIFRSGEAEPVTGGVFGLTRFADGFYALNPVPAGSYGVGALRFDARTVWLLLVAWGLVALGTLLVYLLMRSPWGRVVKAIREDEDAARSLGKNVFAYKMQSLVLGGLLGAIGGMILAINQQAVTPDIFLPQLTFFGYAILLLGGAARIFAPVAGTLIFWFIVAGFDSLLRELARSGLLPAAVVDGQTIGALRFVLVGLGLMGLMIYRPEGVFGDKRELALTGR